MEKITALVDSINGIVWSFGFCVVFILVGLWLSARTRFFQFSRFGLWWRSTVVALFADRTVRKDGGKGVLSRFQALSAALAATIGTGNIVGVATALVSGGPGAVFWMWAAALFGMMIKYAEIVLSMKYRYKNAAGEYVSGPMVFLERGLGCKVLAVIFAVFCLISSFGTGNMSQANSISEALDSTFGGSPIITGAVVALLAGIVLVGGVKRIGAVAERLIPITSVIYIVLGVAVILVNFRAVPSALADIVSSAFTPRAAGGGILGYTVAAAMRFGVARGVFSNEAGLGTSAMVHCASGETEPVRQGMWGIFEVFLDTVVVCTITALVILCTGSLGAADAAGNPVSGAALTILSFSKVLGGFAGIFISVSIALFAFASLLGWCFYGERCSEYLFGAKSVFWYRGIYILAAFGGCLLPLELVWGVCDIFNGLMAVPNLIGVILMSGTVAKLTREYLQKNAPLCRRRY